MRLLLPALLVLLAGCPEPAPPGYPVRSCLTQLTYEAGVSVDTVEVAGEWSGFDPEPMVRGDDGIWKATLGLAPRSYAYQIVIGGDQVSNDRDNPFTRWVGGREYSRLTVEDCALPLIRVDQFRRDVEARGVTVLAQYLAGRDRAAPDPAKTRVLLDGEPIDGAFDPENGRFTVQRQDLPLGKHTIVVEAVDVDGRAARHLYLPFWVEEDPFHWQDAILYFAFTDRFRNGDPDNDAPVAGVDPQANYAGGDFAGITRAIEEGYFDALGVRALWLSPVVANPDGSFGGSFGKQYTGYHGYWPSEPRETQARFGTLEELRALTRAAHARGMRVLTDLVVNHVHESHPYFREHEDEGWFNVGNACVCGTGGCDWEARRLDCWFTGYLPDLNWRSTQVVDQMVSDALWWVEAADLDGFRLDAVKHLDHVAGRTLAGHLNRITRLTGADFYLVGETFTGSDGRPLIADYVSPDELDGQFDFPLYWSILDAFAHGQSLKKVDDAVKANEDSYAPWVLNSPFVGNHDVPRFISHAAGQVEADSTAQAWGQGRPPDHVTDDAAFARAKLALTFALTLPGVPLLYYGDEVGLPGAGDPDNRRMMRFGSALTAREADLLAHVQKVGQARRDHAGLRGGARYTLLVEDDLLVYQRDDSAGTDGALITLHRGALERSVSVSLRGRLGSAEGQVMRDVVSGRTATIHDGRVTLALPAEAAGVWVRRD